MHTLNRASRGETASVSVSVRNGRRTTWAARNLGARRGDFCAGQRETSSALLFLSLALCLFSGLATGDGGRDAGAAGRTVRWRRGGRTRLPWLRRVLLAARMAGGRDMEGRAARARYGRAVKACVSGDSAAVCWKGCQRRLKRLHGAIGHLGTAAAFYRCVCRRSPAGDAWLYQGGVSILANRLPESGGAFKHLYYRHAFATLPFLPVLWRLFSCQPSDYYLLWRAPARRAGWARRLLGGSSRLWRACAVYGDWRACWLSARVSPGGLGRCGMFSGNRCLAGMLGFAAHCGGGGEWYSARDRACLCLPLCLPLHTASTARRRHNDFLCYKHTRL